MRELVYIENDWPSIYLAGPRGHNKVSSGFLSQNNPLKIHYIINAHTLFNFFLVFSFYIIFLADEHHNSSLSFWMEKLIVVKLNIWFYGYRPDLDSVIDN